jgi:hypothetical protein
VSNRSRGVSCVPPIQLLLFLLSSVSVSSPAAWLGRFSSRFLRPKARNLSSRGFPCGRQLRGRKGHGPSSVASGGEDGGPRVAEAWSGTGRPRRELRQIQTTEEPRALSSRQDDAGRDNTGRAGDRERDKRMHLPHPSLRAVLSSLLPSRAACRAAGPSAARDSTVGRAPVSLRLCGSRSATKGEPACFPQRATRAAHTPDSWGDDGGTARQWRGRGRRAPCPQAPPRLPRTVFAPSAMFRPSAGGWGKRSSCPAHNKGPSAPSQHTQRHHSTQETQAGGRNSQPQ